MAVKNNESSSNRTIGQIFTPKYIAEFMVKNIIRVLKTHCYDSHDSLKLNELKVLEPATGQGIFLKVLLENDFRDITAYEIDGSLRKCLESTYPEVSFKFTDFLSSSIEEKYDLIIGNPPYLGQNYNSSVFRDLIKNYYICEKYFIGNMDLFYYFIHLGIEKLNPGGFLSFITTNYWITKSKKTGIKYLKPHIIEECFFLEYYDLSRLNVFKDAQGQHNCIFILQKKMKQHKDNHINKPIQVYQYRNDLKLIEDFSMQSFMTYRSGLANSDLSRDSSWNLLYPTEIKEVVEKIESFCKKKNGTLSLLKDLFIVRNGLILIKDDIFILKEDKNLQISKDEVFINIENTYKKINNNEKARLKKLYKGKSIRPYGYDRENFYGFLIYFPKDHLKFTPLQKKYPNLIKYLSLHQKELEQTLKNAKEDPNNIYYPRRGGSILIFDENGNQKKVDLEPYYEFRPKIFFPYISDKNVFGFCSSSYYATSDTYFLWPKDNNSDIDYPFWLAYLNSSLVTFLFKAKNVVIKRSKTKLENNLPIPNLLNFQTNKQMEMITLIRYLSKQMIELNTSRNSVLSRKERNEIVDYLLIHDENFNKFIDYTYKVDPIFIKKIIDNLFFRLFNLDENDIDYLTKKYYYT